MFAGTLIVGLPLLLLLSLLAIPVSFTFTVSLKEDLQSDVEVGWAFGLIRIRNPSFPSKEKASKPKVRKPKRGRLDRAVRRGTNLVAIIKQEKFRRRVLKYFGDLWRAVRKKDLSLHLCLGLDDPADTGRLWGIVGPLSGMLANIREAFISIEPNFHEPTFDLESHGSIRIVPLQIVYLTVGLFISPSVWGAMRQFRASRT